MAAVVWVGHKTSDDITRLDRGVVVQFVLAMMTTPAESARGGDCDVHGREGLTCRPIT